VNTRDSLGSELAPLLRAPAAFADAMAVGRTPLHWAAANGHVQVPAAPPPV
jgi:ankyrin repeat protein